LEEHRDNLGGGACFDHRDLSSGRCGTSSPAPAPELRADDHRYRDRHLVRGQRADNLAGSAAPAPGRRSHSSSDVRTSDGRTGRP